MRHSWLEIFERNYLEFLEEKAFERTALEKEVTTFINGIIRMIQRHKRDGGDLETLRRRTAMNGYAVGSMNPEQASGYYLEVVRTMSSDRWRKFTAIAKDPAIPVISTCLRWLLMDLEEYGILERKDPDLWKLSKSPPFSIRHVTRQRS